MLQVGRAKGWEVEDLTTLFQRATAFEPEFFYYYQELALSLMPKWRGKEGDVEKFAEESANRAGGQARRDSVLADRAGHPGQPRSRQSARNSCRGRGRCWVIRPWWNNTARARCGRTSWR